MNKLRYPPIAPAVPHLLHGGDYNPEQWRKTPAIWDEDIRLMKLSGCNAMSVGIFAWAAPEPNEGEFDFSWLDTIMDKFADNGIYAVLATPSAARPAWMSRKYPEVLRVDANRIRILHGIRHNHCYTSPVYREKCRIINAKLAERYKNHPALILWHVSNEYSGECHCELCQEAFRDWLRQRYDQDLEKLNHAWWTAFWSHTFSDWSQIESPAPHGERHLPAMVLDWKRFVTDQTLDFFKHEIQPLRELTPRVPVTTNFMGTYPGLNYWKFAEFLDVISWDSYPPWGTMEISDWELASRHSFLHDINRSLKNGKPFMLMESTPSVTNGMHVARLKRPGLHLTASLLAIAHGSDTVQYFQWRKSRGGWEKFHGAVVDHCGNEHTRVFRDVAEVGNALKKLDMVVGMQVPAEVAIIYDWENRWAIDSASGPRQEQKHYEETCIRHHRVFWKSGIPTDVISMDCDFSKYKFLIAPMLYMLRPGVAERIAAFVKNGGTFVTTYWSGIVDETDLCFLGGFPGPLRELLGIWSEELDVLNDGETRSVLAAGQNSLNLTGDYKAHIFCDLIHAETAEVLATYEDDFYAGFPALTRNRYGKEWAFYIASRNEDAFLDLFYSKIISELAIKKTLDAVLPEGVTAQVRTDGEQKVVFVLNFTQEPKTIGVGSPVFQNILNDDTITGTFELPPWGCVVLKE
ncbi:beta-galactosidase [candidate division KSB1 bacterium]|nr:beta-galactosidase [candidate division KSB1 bacterium]